MDALKYLPENCAVCCIPQDDDGGSCGAVTVSFPCGALRSASFKRSDDAPEVWVAHGVSCVTEPPPGAPDYVGPGCGVHATASVAVHEPSFVEAIKAQAALECDPSHRPKTWMGQARTPDVQHFYVDAGSEMAVQLTRIARLHPDVVASQHSVVDSHGRSHHAFLSAKKRAAEASRRHPLHEAWSSSVPYIRINYRISLTDAYPLKPRRGGEDDDEDDDAYTYYYSKPRLFFFVSGVDAYPEEYEFDDDVAREPTEEERASGVRAVFPMCTVALPLAGAIDEGELPSDLALHIGMSARAVDESSLYASYISVGRAVLELVSPLKQFGQKETVIQILQREGVVAVPHFPLYLSETGGGGDDDDDEDGEGMGAVKARIDATIFLEYRDVGASAGRGQSHEDTLVSSPRWGVGAAFAPSAISAALSEVFPSLYGGRSLLLGSSSSRRVVPSAKAIASVREEKAAAAASGKIPVDESKAVAAALLARGVRKSPLDYTSCNVARLREVLNSGPISRYAAFDRTIPLWWLSPPPPSKLSTFARVEETETMAHASFQDIISSAEIPYADDGVSGETLSWYRSLDVHMRLTSGSYATRSFPFYFMVGPTERKHSDGGWEAERRYFLNLFGAVARDRNWHVERPAWRRELVSLLASVDTTLASSPSAQIPPKDADALNDFGELLASAVCYTPTSVGYMSDKTAVLDTKATEKATGRRRVFKWVATEDNSNAFGAGGGDGDCEDLSDAAHATFTRLLLGPYAVEGSETPENPMAASPWGDPFLDAMQRLAGFYVPLNTVATVNGYKAGQKSSGGGDDKPPSPKKDAASESLPPLERYMVPGEDSRMRIADAKDIKRTAGGHSYMILMAASSFYRAVGRAWPSTLEMCEMVRRVVSRHDRRLGNVLRTLLCEATSATGPRQHEMVSAYADPDVAAERIEREWYAKAAFRAVNSGSIKDIIAQREAAKVPVALVSLMRHEVRQDKFIRTLGADERLTDFYISVSEVYTDALWNEAGVTLGSFIPCTRMPSGTIIRGASFETVFLDGGGVEEGKPIPPYGTLLMVPEWPYRKLEVDANASAIRHLDLRSYPFVTEEFAAETLREYASAVKEFCASLRRACGISPGVLPVQELRRRCSGEKVAAADRWVHRCYTMIHNTFFASDKNPEDPSAVAVFVQRSGKALDTKAGGASLTRALFAQEISALAGHVAYIDARVEPITEPLRGIPEGIVNVAFHIYFLPFSEQFKDAAVRRQVEDLFKKYISPLLPRK